MMDRIDGGFSFLIRCPGYDPSKAACFDGMSVDAYISPRELAEGDEKLQSAITSILGIFNQEIVPLHLQRYAAHCNVEGVKPRHPPGKLKFYIPKAWRKILTCSGGDLQLPGRSFSTLLDPTQSGSSRFRLGRRCGSSQVQDSAITTAPENSVERPLVLQHEDVNTALQAGYIQMSVEKMR